MRYRHYKGGEYEVICLATNEDDLIDVVVYKSIIDEVGDDRERVNRFQRIKDDEAQGQVVRGDSDDVPPGQ